ncbi:MAG: hypothetical protein AAB443_03260 [Patescibacteria group bacterium]
MDLSQRQIELLKAIVEEYTKSTEPVGSQKLVGKYNLKVSPATVRNEMADLIRKGFLEMRHTSSGRVPTTMGFRLYVDEIMHEAELPILQEVAMKQRLWPARFEFEKLLRQASLALADVTKQIAVTTTNDGHLFHSGSVNVLESPEFWDIDVAKAALHLIDSHDILHNVFEKGRVAHEVMVTIGEEMALPNLNTCCLVYSKFDAGRRSGVVSVLGPSRMEYSTVVPAVRFIKSQIEELGATW